MSSSRVINGIAGNLLLLSGPRETNPVRRVLAREILVRRIASVLTTTFLPLHALRRLALAGTALSA